jgi:hypothetical protein
MENSLRVLSFFHGFPHRKPQIADHENNESHSLRIVNWRNISISLINVRFGKQTAQAIAAYVNHYSERFQALH